MDDITNRYVGRFAPSPTGPLHQGSLLAALASYLDARKNAGRWLLRMEDVDVLRNVAGADKAILEALALHGLLWDEKIIYQTARQDNYQQALNSLIEADRIFYCDCTRARLKQKGGAYPGYCRKQKRANYQLTTDTSHASHAIRFNIATNKENPVVFVDQIFGRVSIDLAGLGDFVIRRRDALFSYQFAVTVDDLEQGITHVVRGADLLDSTAWQIALIHALTGTVPQYAHLPLIVHADRSKLSKQTGAHPLDCSQPSNNLLRALKQLKQPVSNEWQSASPAEILDQAVASWDISRVGKKNIILNQ